MEILSEGPLDLTFLDAQLRPAGVGRAKILHQSQVISYIGRTAMGEKTWAGPAESAETTLYTELGFLYEGWVERMLYRMKGVVRSPELVLDGIAMNPDGINKVEKEVIECKLSFKSLRKWREDVAGNFWKAHFWHWQAQTKGYCAKLGYRKARYLVCFPMGDYTYKDNVKERVRELVVKFSDEDIIENWRMILANAPATAREIGVEWRPRKLR